VLNSIFSLSGIVRNDSADFFEDPDTFAHASIIWDRAQEHLSLFEEKKRPLQDSTVFFTSLVIAACWDNNYCEDAVFQSSYWNDTDYCGVKFFATDGSRCQRMLLDIIAFDTYIFPAELERRCQVIQYAQHVGPKLAGLPRQPKLCVRDAVAA